MSGEQTSLHTPGPWSFVDHSWCDKSVYARLYEVTERRIASFHLDEEASEEEEATEIANARLIAAAPDLLAVLHEAEKRPLCTESPDWWIQVRAAIAKATGAVK